MRDLQGKSVLVTGGARRIGRAIALACADAGANVAITYRSSKEAAKATLSELNNRNHRALALPCDVRDKESVLGAVSKVVSEFEGIDVLVNNAAVYETAHFDSITLEQWDRMFNTNTRGPFLVTRAALESLRSRNGRVVNIGSLGGIRPWATHAHYCASKAALIMLTQAMAKALAPEIPVNCIAPGMICMSDTQPDDLARRIMDKTPMKRPGNVQDVVDAVLFFATATPFITGQVLAVDGGLGLD